MSICSCGESTALIAPVHCANHEMHLQEEE